MMKASEIKLKFEEEAFQMDRKYFFASTSVDGGVVNRCAFEYDFTGSHFKWLQVASKGCANGGWFVPSGAKTPEARAVMARRDADMAAYFAGYNFSEMKRAPRFWELLNKVDDLISTNQRGWLEWFANARINSWRAARECGLDDLASSIPRINALQKIIAAALKAVAE